MLVIFWKEIDPAFFHVFSSLSLPVRADAKSIGKKPLARSTSPCFNFVIYHDTSMWVYPFLKGSGVSHTTQYKGICPLLNPNFFYLWVFKMCAHWNKDHAQLPPSLLPQHFISFYSCNLMIIIKDRSDYCYVPFNWQNLFKATHSWTKISGINPILNFLLETALHCHFQCVFLGQMLITV